ncbi:MAG TPA: N-glycosylase/DNA lyase [Candidatus Nanoarchaeia archaeon]|nr:N-glycosylase/DNA lyase [Candidatus Nanoarchaeia archaeon]
MTLTLSLLRKKHRESRKQILERLREFEQASREGDRRLFEELTFCILAANTSSKMSAKCVDALRPVLFTGKPAHMKKKLVGIYRFINLRPAYIYHTRSYLEKKHGFQLQKLMSSFQDPHELRDFFALNPNIKGIGYKEASHFLRNIGYKGYCILDKHILNSLHELGVIAEVKRPANQKQYHGIEEKMKTFCREVKINVDEMDLLLWSMKTGEILK